LIGSNGERLETLKYVVSSIVRLLTYVYEQKKIQLKWGVVALYIHIFFEGDCTNMVVIQVFFFYNNFKNYL